MAQANSHHTTNLSFLIRDPFIRAAFKGADDDGLAPALVESDHPRTPDGGAAERMTETNRPSRAGLGGGVSNEARSTTDWHADCRARTDSGGVGRATS